MATPLLRQWVAYPTTQAVNLVKRILVESPQPLSTKQIYKLAHEYERSPPISSEQRPPGADLAHRRACQGIPSPPHPDHPIRSIRYLKKIVLPALECERKVEKIHIKNTPTEEDLQRLADSKTKANRKAARIPLNNWVWRIPPPPDPDAPPKPPKPPASKLAAAVGLNEDYSHLNKRRKRTRDKKLTKLLAVAKMMNRKERHEQELARASAASANASDPVLADDSSSAPAANV